MIWMGITNSSIINSIPANVVDGKCGGLYPDIEYYLCPAPRMEGASCTSNKGAVMIGRGKYGDDDLEWRLGDDQDPSRVQVQVLNTNTNTPTQTQTPIILPDKPRSPWIVHLVSRILAIMDAGLSGRCRPWPGMTRISVGVTSLSRHCIAYHTHGRSEKKTITLQAHAVQSTRTGSGISIRSKVSTGWHVDPHNRGFWAVARYTGTRIRAWPSSDTDLTL
jgi:hypothetical protein